METCKNQSLFCNPFLSLHACMGRLFMMWSVFHAKVNGSRFVFCGCLSGEKITHKRNDIFGRVNGIISNFKQRRSYDVEFHKIIMIFVKVLTPKCCCFCKQVCALIKLGSWVLISRLWVLNIFIVTIRSVIWRQPHELVRSVWTIIGLAFIHMKLQRSCLILQAVCMEIVRSSMCQRSQRTGGRSLAFCRQEKEHKMRINICVWMAIYIENTY